ncbi:putative Orphan nuclear receptor NR2E1 [Operophtera brumata]|uniref:Putative Orphan nuclear receptor NR2E1 n=1 Tax=Operophtera brumata TaxID=104452 RepID=A0A0L7LQ55_OPEBR|nr:putative Orphan nuclear receptor NR2E1 [Operophtera brumata]
MITSPGRILYDVPCGVCKDHSSGKHYGVFACDGCAGFFKRSVRRERNYLCKARMPGSCMIDKTHRNQCRSCRLAKCLDAGMNKDAVQHERGPRNSTIRRQMALYSKDLIPSPEIGLPMSTHIPTSPTMPKTTLLPSSMPLALSLFSHPFAHFNGVNLFNTPSVIVPAPTPMPPVFSMRSNILHRDDPQKQCEVAARLLFLNVKWTKSIVPFESLSLPDRLLLLEESWAELFVLGLAQYLYPIDLNVIFDRGWARIDRTYVEIFESVLVEIAKIRPDPDEYMYLRSLIMFKTTFDNGVDNDGRSSTLAHNKRLQDLPAVAEVQSRVLTHTATTYPREMSRASQLHQILSMLKTVSGHTIIELFFRNTIGDISVERIITDLYKSGRIPVIPFNL